MKTHSAFPPHSSRKGFTLIELMVAMSITSVIILILVVITGGAVDTWQRSRAEVRASRQAKAMFDTISRDFESYSSRRGNKFQWLDAEVEPQLPGPDANKSPNAAKLIFFTAATDRYDGDVGGSKDKGGDISCVGYRLAYQDPVVGEGGGSDTTKTFALYRLLVNPDDTFKSLLGQEDLSSAFASYDGKVKDVENFVCENIYEMTMTFHVEFTNTTASSETTQTVRMSLGQTADGTYFKVLGSGIKTDVNAGGLQPTVSSEQLAAGRLTAVEIGVTVLTDTGLNKLNNSGLTQVVREKIMAQESYHYTRVIKVPSM
jgi:prepilin-type N-terminal cleavage/methylation domain-containing protein